MHLRNCSDEQLLEIWGDLKENDSLNDFTKQAIAETCECSVQEIYIVQSLFCWRLAEVLADRLNFYTHNIPYLVAP